MTKLRWGILGCAKIAREHLIPAIQASSCAEVVAAASRSLDSAESFASDLNIPKAYGSYQALLDDPTIDAVYNPMPNHLHVPWSVKALEAGKHVLCEKPLGLTAADLNPLISAAAKYPNLLVREAFMYRFHPQWLEAKKIVESGALGEIKSLDATFTYNSFDPENVRYKAEWGGGGLLDVGCYCVSAARYLFGGEPQRVISTLDLDPRCAVDRHASGLLEFESGSARFTCSMQVESTQNVSVLGTKGRLVIESPFYLPADGQSRLLLSIDGCTEQKVFANENHYQHQIESFAKIVGERQFDSSLALNEALCNMKVLDALFQSNKSASWVHVEHNLPKI